MLTSFFLESSKVKGITVDIVVIGTSNSIKANSGMLKSMKLEHKVIQLSVGRVPFYYHIKTILNNREVLEAADCVIIDHYINDINFYADKLGEEYEQLLKEFYKLIASLNVNVINILFPIFDISKHKNNNWYRSVLSLSKTYAINIIDLNLLPLEEMDYDDPIHIGNEISYHIGTLLSACLNRLSSLKKPSGGEVSNSLWRVIEASDLKYNTSELSVLKVYKNSLVNLEYLDLKSTLHIPLKSEEKILSLGYLNPKQVKGNSAITINEQSFTLDGTGYFHEALLDTFSGDVYVTPVTEDGKYPNLILRNDNAQDNFNHAYLVDMLIYNPRADYETKQAIRECLNISIDLFITHITNIKNLMPEVEPSTVDFLRDHSLEIKGDNFSLAFDLMKIAQRFRPTGQLINKTIRQFKKKN